MGLFTRRTKYRLETPATPVPPGRELTAVLRAERVRPGTRVGTLYVDVECSGRKDTVPVQSEGLAATSVSTQVRVVRHETEVDAELAVPEDAVELKVWLPWWAPVARIGDQRLLGGLQVVVGHGYAAGAIETEGLPFHEALLGVAADLGWAYRRCEVWDVGGTKRPAEQRLWFSPGDGFEGKGFKLAHVEVVALPTGPDAGTLAVTVFGRKLGPGLFPLGRLDAVPLAAGDPSACAEALRTGLAGVIGGGGVPTGVEVDGQVVEALLRVLFRG